MKETALSVTISALVGLLIFLILLGLANIISINNSIYIQIVDFLNQNVGRIIIFSILFYLGELFFVFKFPFNLPGPLFNAFGSIYLITFIFGIIYLIGSFVEQDLLDIIGFLEPVVKAIVFILVIIVGYVMVIVDLSGIKERCKGVKRGREKRSKEKGKKQRKKEGDDDVEKIEWQDIGKEFKEGLYNLGVIFRKCFEPEKSKKKGKRRGEKKKKSKKKK